MNPEKLRRMQERVRTGGKGSMRRKFKAAHKTTVTDDKKLHQTLKRLGLQSLQGIDEVNLFREDEHVIHFSSPKLQAAIQANTFVVSGNAQTKTIDELMPDILTQLGQEKMQQLAQRMRGMEGLSNLMGQAQAAAAGGDDDDVPDLVDTNFEETAKANNDSVESVD
eukprot:TRINITY_DN71_c0_g1_i1.p2 TRINITY_DN71_c0_g1~~TRINITY_DN71_c0_g1_i1.p2  ORF type:complete len:166 (-),score=66.42 TRINITY_DN71_c0_g1_i1:101-598(-)